MALRVTWPPSFMVITPGGILNSNNNLQHLETKTYTRKLTYGQCTALKFLTCKFLKKLGVNKEMLDLTCNKTEGGQPGYKDTFRVRIRYR